MRLARTTESMFGPNIIRRDSGNAWVDTGKLQKRLDSFGRNDAEAVQERLLGLVGQWGLVGNWSMYLLVGWCLAQWCQTAWPWRPHLWICGPSGTGKTQLLRLMTALAGKLGLLLEGSLLTEPGLRQAVGPDAALVAIDEFERSHHREQIMRLLLSGRGGTIAKGTPSQVVKTFQFQHMVAMASIELGADSAREISRYLILETVKDITRRPTIPSAEDLDEFRVEVVAAVLWSLDIALDLFHHPVELPGGYDTRLVDSYRVPAAMVAVVYDDPWEAFEHYLKEFLGEWKQYRSGDIEEDEVSVLSGILNSSVRVYQEAESELGKFSGGIYTHRTVQQLIELASAPLGLPESHKDSLAASGIRLVDDGIFLDPGQVVRTLLKDTKWKGYNVRTILLRIPGTKKARRRLAGGQPHGLLIPTDAYLPRTREEEFSTQ